MSDDAKTWPKHPDGKPYKFGELTPEQQRTFIGSAARKMKRELESPEMAEAILGDDEGGPKGQGPR